MAIPNEKALRFHGAVQRLFNLKNPDAVIVLKTLMKKGHFNTSTFVAGAPDLSAFQEGQRHIVCSLLSCMTKDPDKLIQQLKELENETTA